MKHRERKFFLQSGVLKRVACLTLALPAFLVIPVASATTGHSPGADTIWCNGDGTPYAAIPGYPGDTLPFGVGLGPNPPDTWDGWGNNQDLINPPNFGEMLTTVGPYSEPTMVNNVYAVHLNYWNSIVNANPDYANNNDYNQQQKSPFGHSPGHSCMTFAEYGSNRVSAFGFTITYPASPSKPDPREVAFHASHPNDYPSFVPYVDGPTAGGPTGYISTFKGCNWDGNSCTMGSKVPTGAETVTPSSDINVFPKKLSDITTMPTVWNITSEPYYGHPFDKDKTQQVWDASYDIWFDKTAHTDEGLAPYGNVRGQNDGLEIMVWMHSNGSYVDSAVAGQRPAEGQSGLAQPTGHIRERVLVAGRLYDVWVGRLNNPYFGYAGSTVIPANEIAGNCPLSLNKGAAGELCGVEWNVVSFVATVDANGNDSRNTSLALDGTILTNYLLGIADNRYSVESTVDGSIPGSRTTPLQCPASNKNQSLSAATIDCLKPDWYLMSIQAGFETWIGGNGLQSQNFLAYAGSKPSMSALSIINAKGAPIINPTTTFNAVYAGCTKYSSTNHVAFTITGSNGTTNVTYPANGTKIDMGPQNPRTLQFNYSINDPAFAIRGDAVAHYTSACGNFDAPLFVDNTGKVFYSNGTTPVQGATVTLQYSPSGNQNGPFVPVPNMNLGLTTPVMQLNGNTYNPMQSSAAGTYGWNLVPGWYKVVASYKGTTVTSAAQQVTATKQVQNLGITLPLTAPLPAGGVTQGVTVTLTPNGTDAEHSYCRNVVLKNSNKYAVAWKVQFKLPFSGGFLNNNFWNFNYSRSGDIITAWGVDYNKVLAAGATSNSIGFCATK